jgi:cytosine/uracil/thiamine/allantoin permease
MGATMLARLPFPLDVGRILLHMFGSLYCILLYSWFVGLVVGFKFFCGICPGLVVI